MKSIRMSQTLWISSALLALFAIATLPGMAAAATYAYVNADGIVMTHESTDPTSAIATAPNIHMHSGVMLLDSTADNEVVGEDVPVS